MTVPFQFCGTSKFESENVEFRAVIEKHVDLSSLKALARELIEILRSKTLEHKEKEFVNKLVKEIKQGLKVRTAATQVEDVDLYEVSMDSKRIQRFTEIVGFIKKEADIRGDDPRVSDRGDERRLHGSGRNKNGQRRQDIICRRIR